MKSIRILIILNSVNMGGAEFFLMNIYRNIDREKIQFDFLIHTNKKCDFEDEILSLGGKIFRIPKYCFFNHFLYSKLFDKFLKEHKEYKIINCQQYNIASVCLKIAKQNGRITICHSHSSKSDVGLKGIIKSLFRKNINKYTDYAFACSNNSGKYLYGNREFKVINNCIDSQKYIFDIAVRNKIRKNLNIPTDSIVLGHVGCFREVKNHSFIIDIFKDYNKENSNSYLILVGEGSLFDNIKNKVNELGLQDKILFLGLCNNVHEIMQAMDIFIFPSIYEGLPVSLIEAQATGLKCLISDRITNEVILCKELVKQLPIDKGTMSWINELNKLHDYKRLDMSECIINANYDVNNLAENLTNFYLEL